MVASTVPKAPTAPSYAERARKGQGIKSASTSSRQQEPSHVQAAPSIALNGASASASSPPNPTPSKNQPTPMTIEPIKDSDAQTPSSKASHPTSPLGNTPDDAAPALNGEARSPGIAATGALPKVTPPSGTNSPPSSAKVPVENVWNIRKEKMAAQASRLPASSPPASQPPKSSVKPVIPPSSASISQASSSTASTHLDDPFVVRMPNSSRAPRPPVDDDDSWPEVGKSVVQTASSSGNDVSSNSKDQDAAPSHPNTPKKSEKPKWVPIPPEELQAVADAALKSTSRGHSRSHSRAQSQQNGQSGSRSAAQKSANTSQHASAMGSASASQSQSRMPSGRNSTVQSRIQSRSGSAQSSPRTMRSRKLDDPAAQFVTPPNVPASEEVKDGSSSNSPKPPQVCVDTADQGGSIPISYPTPIYGRPQPIHAQGVYYPHQGPHLPPIQQPPSQSSFRHSPISPSPFGHPLGPVPGATGPRYHTNHSPVPMATSGQPPFSPTGGYPMYPTYVGEYYGANPGPPYWNGPMPPHGYVLSTGQQTPPYPPMMHYPPPPMPLQQHPEPPQNFANAGMTGMNVPAPDSSANERSSEIAGPVPPPTMMHHPPPPEESQPVAGYRAVGPVPEPQSWRAPDVTESLGERPVVFGSIGVPGSSSAPSPSLSPSLLVAKAREEREKAQQADDELEKTFTMFSIGVSPGEPAPPRLRSRTRSVKAQSRTEIGTLDNGTASASTGHARLMSDLTNSGGRHSGDASVAKAGTEEPALGEGATVGTNIVDLTDTETKWQFGSTATANVDSLPPVLPESTTSPLPPAHSVMPAPEPYAGDSQLAPPHLPPSFPHPTSNMHPVETSVPLASQPLDFQPVPYPEPPMADVSARPTRGQMGDEWEVRDFGYGFGVASGTGYAPALAREERIAREKQRQFERSQDIDRVAVAVEVPPQQPQPRPYEERERGVRPRRGSYGGFGNHDRGSFPGRRGRGLGFGRGFNRHIHRGSIHSISVPAPARQPPFTVTPPQQFQPLTPLGDATNGFYPPAPAPAPAPYIPMAYEAYPPQPPQNLPVPVQSPPTAVLPGTIPPSAAGGANAAPAPPVPVPVSTLSFPLDPTRYYLLGQLEYYLSPQNMAQDLYLRQNMDSQGWIPISLLASFRRVRQLTAHEQVVHEVLTLSSVVQVKGDYVRMGGWEQFVLPDARQSSVDVQPQYIEHNDNPHNQYGDETQEAAVEQAAAGSVAENEGEEYEGEMEVDVEDDDEEDVVFVMDREAQRWLPERRPH